MTEAELETNYPDIEWREPLPARVTGGAGAGLACRFCIAMTGLRGRDIPALPQTEEEFEEHLKAKHDRLRKI